MNSFSRGRRSRVPIRSPAFVALALCMGASAERGARRDRRALEPPPPIAREFRAAWATPIEDRGLHEWPSSPGLAPDSQRAELRAMLDHASSIGLNAIILHVRLAGDALYPSTYAPWSAYLTGASGRAPKPAYDPLAYAIEQAHQRGLQLHAWFNPFRAMLPRFAGKAAASHVTRKHPAWIRRYGSQTWIDPGEPAARAHVLAAMLDVVRRYDVDGIQIDDYFYPYRETHMVVRRVRKRRVRRRVTIPFPDDRTWMKYGKARGFTDRAVWRRSNIDTFVESLYEGVKAIKPTVLVGISPFGIWRPGSPDGITGLDSYAELYADSRRWLTEGWLDYLAPQLYWPLDGSQNRFRALDAWWRSENARGRHVWPGLYSSRVIGAHAWPLDEIGKEIATLRDGRAETGAALGHVHFRLAALFANHDSLARDLRALYRDPALVPASPWLAPRTPAAPAVTTTRGDGPAMATLALAPGDSVRVRWWLIQTRTRDGTWTTALQFASDGQRDAWTPVSSDRDEIAVTAIGMAGGASPPTLIMP